MPRATTWCAGAVCAAVWCVAPWCVGQTLPPPPPPPSETAAPSSTPVAGPSSPPVFVPAQARPLEIAETPPVHARERDPHLARRVLLMSLSGAAGGFGGGFGGVMLVAAGDLRVLGSGGNFVALMLGGAAVYLAGLSLSVTLAGYAQGGNGGYGWVLLGGLGGSIVLGGLGTLSEDGYVAGALALAGGVAGSVLAYELSNDARGRRRRRHTARVLPTVGADATGLRLGLGGTF